jgi:acetyl esterase/lipase
LILTFQHSLTSGNALISFDYRLAPETKLPAIINDIEAALNGWAAR